MTLFTSSTTLDAAASRSSTVSEVTRVTSSPGERVGQLADADPQQPPHHRTAGLEDDALAHSPEDDPLDQSPSTEPTTRNPISKPDAGAIDADDARPSSTDLVTIGVASEAPVVPSPSSRPSASVRRWGRTNVHNILRFCQRMVPSPW